MTGIKATTGSDRLEVLDALRGFALFGILFANLYSFIGYNTYNPEEIIATDIDTTWEKQLMDCITPNG